MRAIAQEQISRDKGIWALNNEIKIILDFLFQAHLCG